MKKISRYLLLAAVVMAVFAASGCARSDKGAVFDPDQSSIFVKKDGRAEELYGRQAVRIQRSPGKRERRI